MENITDDLLADFTSAGKATDALTVTQPGSVGIVKRFVDDPAPAGSTTDLEFTITNFDRSNTATDVAFTDDLNATLTGLVATGTLPSDPCGTGSSLASAHLPSHFQEERFPPGGSCTFSVTLQIPAGAVPGSYPNTTTAITANLGGSPFTGGAASDTLFVEPIPVLTMEFLEAGTLAPDPVVKPGDDVVIRYTLTNTSTTSGATDVAFLDELTNPGGGSLETGFLPFPLAVTLPPVPNPPCGAGSSLGFSSPILTAKA